MKYPFKDSQTRKYYKIDFYNSDDQKFHADLSQIPSGIYVLEFKKLREDLWGGDLYQWLNITIAYTTIMMKWKCEPVGVEDKLSNIFLQSCDLF